MESTPGLRVTPAALLAACLLTGCSARETAGPPPQVSERLTSGAAFEGEADVAADSSFVVLISARDGNRDLFRLDPATRAILPLTRTPEDEAGPSISRDGRIAYVVHLANGSALRVLDARGGEPLELAVDPQGLASPSWSPDGATILCARGGGGFLLVDGASGSVRPAPWVLPAEASEPMWSTEGTVVFRAGPAGRGDIYALDPAQSQVPRRLTGTEWDERSPYLRDGLLAFLADPEGVYRPFLLRLDAAEGAVPERVGPPRTRAADPVVWPGGGSLLVAEEGGWEIRYRPLAGEASFTAVPADADHRDPAFDDEARNIFYTSDAGGNDDIYVVDLADGNTANLTTSLDPDDGPDLCTATHRLVYTATREGNAEIVSIDQSGLDEVVLASSPARDLEPCFSPDGTRVAFASDRAGSFDIWIVDAAGGEPVRVTAEDAGNERHPTWIEGGGAIAYQSDRAAMAGLWKVDLESGVPTRLALDADASSSDSHPCASADGSRLVFTRTRNGDADLWILDLAEGEASPAVVDPLENQDHGSWSRDGTTVTYQQGGSRDLIRRFLPAARGSR